VTMSDCGIAMVLPTQELIHTEEYLSGENYWH
jgi:hypothetical protein